ncbi:GDSL-type esterase/lipase family protein [Rummeliibacillus sp. JY-2-4R]
MKNRVRVLTIVNVILLVALITIVVQTKSFADVKKHSPINGSIQKSFVLRPSHYEQRQTLFERLSITKESTVMLGDSMILYNEWAEEFPVGPILNRGIGGDTTVGLLNRLDTITSGQPKRIILMIGVNDISKGFTKKQTLNNYDKILKNIENKSPKTKIIITSVLPVNNKLMHSNRVQNAKVNRLNKGLEHLASKHKITMVNIHDQFLKGNQLDSKFTSDGLHLNGDGYAIWVNALKPYLKK